MNAKDYLNAYKGDLKYHYNTKEGIEAVNHMTCTTPYFDTDSEYLEYYNDIEYVIKQSSIVDLHEVTAVIDALIDTVCRITDLENVYNDDTGQSFTMDEVLDVYKRLVLRAEVD